MNVDLRGAFWTPSATILGSASKMYERIVRSIFANGEQGFAYDPNDLTTLYQDAVGNYPVTAAGQPVGLVLDKSKGLTIGAELITNGDFNSGTTGWKSVDGFGVPTNTSMSVLNGVMTCAGTNGVKVQQNKTLTTGKWYKLTCDVVSTDVAISLVAAKGEDLTNMITLAPTIVTTGKRTTYFMATQADIFVGIRANTAGSFSFDNFTLKEIAGNHAYQSVSASRPILQQTPILGNELVANGDFSNGLVGWNNISSFWTTVSGRAYHAASYAYNELSKNIGSQPQKCRIVFDCELISASNTASWFYVNGAGTVKVQQLPTGSSKISVDISDGIKSFGFSRSAGNTAQFYIDSVSVKEITGYRTDQNYLAFDGVDDFLQTNNIDFTATDKVSLFAGVRKLSDSSYATIAELGAADNTLGSFGIGCAGQLGDSLRRTYISNMCGSSKIAHGVYVFAAPTSNVLSTRFDLAKSGAATTVMRVDSLISPKVTENTTTGGGVYGNHPFFIGRRNGSILPFSGNIYSLIGISRLTDDAETLALEKAIAKQTGAVLNV